MFRLVILSTDYYNVKSAKEQLGNNLIYEDKKKLQDDDSED